MRRNCKKIISLVLTLALLLSLTTPALAYRQVEDAGGMTTLSGTQSAAAGAAAGEAAAMFGGSFGTWALEQLAGGVLSSIAGFGVNKAMSAIFGDNDKSSQILNAIAELSTKLDGISSKLDDMQKGIQTQNLRNMLNDYNDFIGGYYEMFSLLSQKQEAFAEDGELTKQFLLQIYDGNNANYRIRGDGLLSLTSLLKAKLLEVKDINGTKVSIFGAIDLLDRYTYKWEHQGYEDRENFRGAAIGIFIQFSSLAKLACLAKMEDCEARGDKFGYNDAYVQYNNLLSQIQAVRDMNDRCGVIKHTDLRIFRNTTTGQDLYAFYPEVTASTWTVPKSFEKDYLKSNDRLQSMRGSANIRSRTYGNSGFEVITTQAWRGDLQAVYNGYGGTKTLYEILFDPNEGNFTNAGNLPEWKWFATDYYNIRENFNKDRRSQWLSTAWYTNLVDNVGELHETVELMDYWVYHGDRNRFLNDSMFNVVKYTGAVKQGSLRGSNTLPDSETANMISGMDYSYELPFDGSVTLSVYGNVYDNGENTYQWLVNTKTDEGVELFEVIENATAWDYTLPPLGASMNGYMYRCIISSQAGGADPDPVNSLMTDPVTLILTGEGVTPPVTEHEIGSAGELNEALAAVTSGYWTGHTLKLTADIVYPYPITMTTEHRFTLDLNGYDLTVQPDGAAEANVNPASKEPELAALYLYGDHELEITGAGSFNVVAGEGVDYGVYAAAGAEITVSSVTLTGGGTAVNAGKDGIPWGGTVDGGITVSGDVSASGENARAVQCFGGSYVKIGGDVAVNGDSSFGVYADSWNESPASIEVDGNITVSGENSRGAFLYAKHTSLTVAGNVTAAGSRTSGIIAGGGDSGVRCSAVIQGSVTAPLIAVNAWDGASVYVAGDVTSSEDNSSAVSSAGANVIIDGDVTQTGAGGTGIGVSKWELAGAAAGAEVTANGTVTADTPISLEYLPVAESGHSAETTRTGYVTYTDGESSVWIMEGSFISTDINAKAPAITEHPQDTAVYQGEVITLSVQALSVDGGVLSYQWYVNNENDYTGGTAVSGATGASYSPAAYGLGNTYYYVIVTNTNNSAQGNKTARVISGVAAVTVAPSAGGGSSSRPSTPSTPAVPDYNAEVDTGDDPGYTLPIAVDAEKGTASLDTGLQSLKQGGTVITIPSIPGVRAYSFSIPVSVLSTAVEQGTLTVNTDKGSITIPSNMLAGLSGISGNKAEITIGQGDKDKLPDDVKAAIGDRPLIQLSLSIDGKQTDWSNPNTPVTVSIPYAPTAAELANPESIVIWYIDGSGNPQCVTNGYYDPAAGTVTFNTTHFSDYAVAYNPVSFNDVASSAWYGKAVSFIAAREITTGTGSGNYSPEAKLTRGEFIVLMMRAYGIAPDTNPTTNFADAGSTYYTGYVAAAKRLGITAGVGNNMYAPGREITRQEMFTLLYNALKVIGQLPAGDSGKTLSDFTDAGQIDAWAKDAMALLVRTGTVGGNAGKLTPAGTTTRAEMAQVLYNLLRK